MRTKITALTVGVALTGLAAGACASPTSAGAPQAASGPAAQGPQAPQAPQAPQPANGPAGGPASGPATGPVSEEQALRLATDTYGGQRLWSGPDHENGQRTWKIKLTGTREGSLDTEISQDSGRIVAVDHEDRDDRDHDHDDDDN